MNNVHMDRRPYLCDHCGKAFKRRDALKQHRLVHEDVNTRIYPFTCHICMKGFRSQVGAFFITAWLFYHMNFFYHSVNLFITSCIFITWFCITSFITAWIFYSQYAFFYHIMNFYHSRHLSQSEVFITAGMTFFITAWIFYHSNFFYHTMNFFITSSTFFITALLFLPHEVFSQQDFFIRAYSMNLYHMKFYHMNFITWNFITTLNVITTGHFYHIIQFLSQHALLS